MIRRGQTDLREFLKQVGSLGTWSLLGPRAICPLPDDWGEVERIEGEKLL